VSLPPPTLDDGHRSGAGDDVHPAWPGRPTRTTSPWWRLAGLGAVLAAGCAYVASYDPEGSSAFYPGCPFNALTGWDCPGCGMTRASHALLTGRPLDALDHNIVFVLVLPLLAWWFLRSVVQSFGRRPPGPSVTWRPWMTWTAIVGIGSFWLLRNLPPLHWLASGLS
jgi:hypothetical protein